MTRLTQRMQSAAEAKDYETAALFRDQIKLLRQLQQKQHVMGDVGDMDVVASAIAKTSAVAAISVFFIRGGRLIGNKTPYWQ